MEGRTKFNYGTNGILSLKDLSYMFSIINSNLIDEEKATQLYAFCNYSTLSKNYRYYSRLSLEKANKIKELMNIYDEYDKKEYFNLSKNPYKCTLQEIELRILKLKEIAAIIYSNDTDYNKVARLLSFYKSAEDFRKAYSLFIKYGKSDARLDSIREELDNFDALLNKFKAYEEQGIVANINYVMAIQDYIHNYEYARVVVCSYINSSDSYKESDFLSSLGIDKDKFDFCIQTIEALDVNLYNQYLEKKERNNQLRWIRNSETITNLANGINTGVLSDGTPFELLEFIKRIPFKSNNNFMGTLIDFMNRNNPQDSNIILSYIYNNKLNLPSAFMPLDLKNLYSSKTIVNGVEITNADNDIIIDYMRVNNIPLVRKAYVLVRAKYLSGEITAEMVQLQKDKSNSTSDRSKLRKPSTERANKY